MADKQLFDWRTFKLDECQCRHLFVIGVNGSDNLFSNSRRQQQQQNNTNIRLCFKTSAILKPRWLVVKVSCKNH